MTFIDRETSLYGGEPIGLFEFQIGDPGLRFLFATGDRDVPVDGQSFVAPGGISRSAIQDSSQRAKNRVTITVPMAEACLPLIDLWRPYPPSHRVLVTIYEIHRADVDWNQDGSADEDAVVAWTGRVLNVKFLDTKVELYCEPSRSTHKSIGQKLRWQRGCTLPLYSQGVGMCNVNPEDYRINATLSYEPSGIQLESPAFGTSPISLAGGYIEYARTDNGLIEQRSIMAHLNNVIFIQYGSNVLPMTLSAFPGCKHNWAGCEEYHNTDNYGGVLTIPVKSVHSGNPVH